MGQRNHDITPQNCSCSFLIHHPGQKDSPILQDELRMFFDVFLFFSIFSFFFLFFSIESYGHLVTWGPPLWVKGHYLIYLTSDLSHGPSAHVSGLLMTFPISLVLQSGTSSLLRSHILFGKIRISSASNIISRTSIYTYSCLILCTY